MDELGCTLIVSVIGAAIGAGLGLVIGYLICIMLSRIGELLNRGKG